MSNKPYDNALIVQNASNLSGVAKSLARDLDEIWEEARSKGLGTDYVNTHPVVKLYVAQLLQLSSGQMFDPDQYAEALRAVEEKAEATYKI